MLNLTPHEVVVSSGLGSSTRTFKASGKVARVAVEDAGLCDLLRGGILVCGVPTDKGLIGMPETATGVIVSERVARFIAALPKKERGQWGPVYSPNSNPGHVKRDAKGHVVSVDSLIQWT